VVRYFFPAEEISLAANENQSSPNTIEGGSLIESGNDRGLEIRMWVVDDTNWDGPRALMPFVQMPGADLQIESPLDAQTVERWQGWGFRLVLVPTDEIDTVLNALRPVQPISNQWLGEFGQWRAIVRAGELRTDRVRVGEGSQQIVRGRPALVARSWIEPVLTDGGVDAGVRLDLGLQIVQPDKRSSRELFAVERERMIEDDGPVVDELILSAVFEGDYALVIVGDAPETQWSDLPEPISVFADQDADAESEYDSEIENDEPTGLGTDAFGPGSGEEQAEPTETDEPESRDDSIRSVPVDRNAVREPSKPKGQTLGELMLTSPGSRITRLNEARIVPKRVVVVLVPRAEGGYSLLPRTAAARSVNNGDQP
tara:strand:+ start:133340 stop:134449 length:1110 start_codon:yes stop_codon:yes gene_type:complete